MPDTLAPAPPGIDPITPEIERLAREIGIPPCPAVLEDFIAETRREEPDFLRVSHLIGKDVALAATVLKTVNSPFYGLRTRVRTIRDALTVLGLTRATRLISGLLLRDAFPKADRAAMERFWDASSKIALITAYLARELEVADVDQAHTFGLFRDCGIPALMSRFPEYRRLAGDAISDGGGPVVARERERFGVDHALLGASLAHTWHLEEALWMPIAHHHPARAADITDAEDPSAKLVAVSLLAEWAWRAARRMPLPDDTQAEEAFVAVVLGAEQERLAPLRGDVTRILAAA